MAHGDKARIDARAAYIYQGLALTQIAATQALPYATLRRWKREAKTAGDDWDTARSAALLSGEGVNAIVAQALEVFVKQFQATMSAVEADKEMPAAEKIKLLASSADALNKTVAASARIAPKISRLGIAWDVLNRFRDFCLAEYPDSAAPLLEVLEPFGNALAEIYADEN